MGTITWALIYGAGYLVTLFVLLSYNTRAAGPVWVIKIFYELIVCIFWPVIFLWYCTYWFRVIVRSMLGIH